MKIKLKISRCDPMGKEGCEPFLQAYDIEAKEGMTILDALHFVKDEQDGTLAFRRSCRSAICGSCAVNLNGIPKLACNTQLITEYKKSGAIVIEPLPNHRIIKDLVVDFNPFWEKMNKIEPWLNPVRGLLYEENTSTIENKTLFKETSNGVNSESAISHQLSAINKKDILKINNSSKCIIFGC